MYRESTYQLEKYLGQESRYTCPECGKRKQFVKYIDQNGNYLHDNVGRCNREIKCGYHKTPRQFFDKNPTIKKPPNIINAKNKGYNSPNYIDIKRIEQACKHYEKNNFALFLMKYFDERKVINVLKMYYVGTSKHWKGATVFPQIDSEKKVRTAKIMLYNKNTGRRVKKPYNHINWLHSVLNKKEFNLKQCVFGEHLIYKNNTICIVESEKTAIIASLVMPQYTWLATGGKNGAKIEPKLFTGKKTILFPDLGVDWTGKAKSIHGSILSNLLEKISTPKDREKGLDIADFLLEEKYDSIERISIEKKQEPNPNHKVFDIIAKKNPAILDLKEKMGLIVTGSGKIKSKENDSKFLTRIALNFIGKCNHKHKNMIPMFDELLSKNLIEEAAPLKDYYFLASSTPF